MSVLTDLTHTLGTAAPTDWVETDATRNAAVGVSFSLRKRFGDRIP